MISEYLDAIGISNWTLVTNKYRRNSKKRNWRVDILGVDILGVDILGVDILRLIRHCIIATVAMPPS